jgi:DNA-binding MarR family transcriptional regulator
MLSRIVAQLGAKGLVRRTNHPEDRRAALVAATASGRRLHERMRAQRNDALVAELAVLSPEEHDRLVAALPALELLAERLKLPR